MAHSVTHVLVPIILLELYRDYITKDRKRFPLHYILIGGIAGLLPDLDVIVFWLLYSRGFALDSIHRTFSHTLFVPLLFIILGFLAIKVKSRKIGKHHMKLSTIFFVIAFGVFVHLLLDFMIDGYIMPFYPFSTYSIGLNLIYLLPFSKEIVSISMPPSIDAILLVLWLIHEEWRHKISDFI